MYDIVEALDIVDDVIRAANFAVFLAKDFLKFDLSWTTYKNEIRFYGYRRNIYFTPEVWSGELFGSVTLQHDLSKRNSKMYKTVF